MSLPAPLLDIAGLRLSLPIRGRPVPVLHGVDLAIAAGETVGLVGESGSGKSLLALSILRLEPDGARLAGGVRFDGIDLLAADERALCAIRGRRIGLVFQEPMAALDPIVRVLDQVARPIARHHRLGRPAAREAARALLARVGLVAPEAWPHQLSGGQRQRALIAMALAGDPSLLIADEPTSALDVLVQREVLDLLAGLVAELGMALLLVSHDFGVIRRAIGRVAVMHEGRIVEDGATAKVLTGPRHPATAALLAASPRLHRC